MDNSGDIYSKENEHQRSPWKRERRRRPIVDAESPGKGADRKSGSSKKTRGSSHSRSIKRRRNRRVLITIAFLAVLAYVGYTGWIALRGLLDRHGVDYENISLVNILGGKEKAGDMPEVPQAPESSDESVFDANRLIAMIDRIKSIERDVEDLLDRGLAANAVERVADAADSLAVSQNLNELLAAAYMQAGDYASAVAIHTRNLISDPDNMDARNDLAEALAKLSEFEGAVAIAKWTLESEPQNTEVRRILADSYSELGSSEQAIREYRRILTENPGDDSVRSKLALAYYNGGEYGRAVNLLSDMVRRGTDDSLAYYNLAICYAKQSLVDEAVDILTRARRKFGPNFVRAWIQSDEFDDIRDETKFLFLVGNLQNNPTMNVRDDSNSRRLDIGSSPIDLDDKTDSLLNRNR